MLREFAFILKLMNMLSYSELVRIITDSAKRPTEGIAREQEGALHKVLDTPKPLKVITGIRRSGKSFLLKRLYRELQEKQIPLENILFLNFEDDRLAPYLNIRGLREIYDLFIPHIKANKPVYLFLDEIQLIKGWEKFVRSLYDATQHHIYLTGSNAFLLSKEFASTLGGRLLEFELYPFSFAEMLEWKHIPFSNLFVRAKNQASLENAFLEYLNYGGLSETFNLEEAAKVNYRKSLIEKIIIHDIINRYNLQSVTLLWNLLSYLEKNTGNLVSYKRIAHVAKVSENTVEQYLKYLQNAFILQKVIKFSWKTLDIFEQSKKYYFIDNIFCLYADQEKQLENLCFQQLQRVYGAANIYMGRDDKGKEVDFVVKATNGQYTAIQVCYELRDDNVKHETSSLKLFAKYLKNSRLQIVYGYNGLSTPPENIELVQVKDFLLGQ